MRMPGMFGGPGGAERVNWSELHFHQKVKHLADTAADYVFSKSSWWLPSIMLAGSGAVMLFSGPMGIPSLMQVASGVVSPVPATSTFGQEMPGQHHGGGGGGGAGEEDEDLDM
jgi:hypothetical protein